MYSVKRGNHREDMGSTTALVHIGDLYNEGIDGAGPNYDEAMKYYKNATDRDSFCSNRRSRRRDGQRRRRNLSSTYHEDYPPQLHKIA